MRVLVISVHPDDETIGCAGRLLKHKAEGDNVYWLIITKAHPPRWDETAILRQEHEVELVGKALGLKQIFSPGLPTTNLDMLPINDLISEISEVISTVHPDYIYSVHHGDIHTDHFAVSQAVFVVLKPFYMQQFGVQRIFSFETISSTEGAPPYQSRSFEPNLFCDISPYIDRKLEIMALYKSQQQDYPMPRSLDSIRALARYRGATIGVEYAEAFILVRGIE